MVTNSSMLPRSMTTWLSVHSAAMLAGMGLSLLVGAAWPLALVGACSFLGGFLANQSSWIEAGKLGGPANAVTGFRLGLMLLAAALGSTLGDLALGLLLAFAAALDGLDGYLARRYDAASLFGEYLDKETDSFFVALGGLLLWQTHDIGLWILVPALLRPLYVFVRRQMNLGDKKEPKFKYGRVLAVVLMVAIPLAFVLPDPLRSWALALAVSLTALSFLKSFVWLFQQQRAS